MSTEFQSQHSWRLRWEYFKSGKWWPWMYFAAWVLFLVRWTF